MVIVTSDTKNFEHKVNFLINHTHFQMSMTLKMSMIFENRPFFLGDSVSYRFLEKSTLSETLSWRVDTFFPDKQKPTLLETLGLGELVIKFVNDAPAIRFGFRRGCWSPN